MKTKKKTKEEIIESYVVYGVAQEHIPRLMKELGRTEKDFYAYMNGQTCGIIGGEPVYYTWDIERFTNGLKVLD